MYIDVGRTDCEADLWLFFSRRRRHSRFSEVSWAWRWLSETGRCLLFWMSIARLISLSDTRWFRRSASQSVRMRRVNSHSAGRCLSLIHIWRCRRLPTLSYWDSPCYIKKQFWCACNLNSCISLTKCFLFLFI